MGKIWHETLVQFLIKDLRSKRSRIEGCLFKYSNGEKWVKMIKHVDDVLHYFNDDNKERILK